MHRKIQFIIIALWAIILFDMAALCGGYAGSVYAADILRVGPGHQFARPSSAAAVVKDGDSVEIDAAGTYDNDTVVWKANNLTIKGVNGRPHIRSSTAIENEKAIWVIRGDNALIENIEFSGAWVPHKNGAGIRLVGRNLHIRNCYFHDNENGILASKNRGSAILVEASEFFRNGHGDGKSHNIYVGKVDSLVFKDNHSHHAIKGHNLKTRAAENYILNNKFEDGEDGNASYQIDIAEGGLAFVHNNHIQQGRRAENFTMLSYGAEGIHHSMNKLILMDNSFINEYGSGNFLRIKGQVPTWFVNNSFQGAGEIAGRTGGDADMSSTGTARGMAAPVAAIR